MYKFLMMMVLLLPSFAIANMSAHEEFDLFLYAIDEIETTNNTHPNADTLDALNEAVANRAKFIEERRQDGTDDYVIVNIGSQRLTIVENKVSISSQKVIVGRDSRQTPTFSDKLRYIVTNPYWNVPRSLSTLDVIPKLVEEPALLEEYGYEMIDNSTNLPVEFNPAADLRRYRMRQNPGPKNALGDIKFMFDPVPNRNIYLHDTPDTYLFDNDVRRYSSGCIRLEDPQSFGEYLLGGKPIPKSDKNDQWLKLPKPVTVHIVDWPVYADADGSIIVNDVTGERFKSLSVIQAETIEF